MDMRKKESRKELVKSFENMVNRATARAYSKLSLERPLTEHEFKEYKNACKKLGIEV
jgi:hypothetical protein